MHEDSRLKRLLPALESQGILTNVLLLDGDDPTKAFLSKYSTAHNDQSQESETYTTKDVTEQSGTTYESILETHKALLARVVAAPYNVLLRVALSDSYRQLKYPDLAAGEAYRVLLLLDEIREESGEYHDLVCEATRSLLGSADQSSDTTETDLADSEFVKECSEVAYQSLISGLEDCGCRRSATEFCIQMLRRHPRLLYTTTSRNVLDSFVDICDAEGLPLNLDKSLGEVSDVGEVRRELYPWNEHEPNRLSQEVVEMLNGWMEKVAPRLEVKATSLPALGDDADPRESLEQLGVFAKQDLQPGETILDEVSVLTASSRLNDTFCDACSVSLSDEKMKSRQPVACEDCGDTVFCSEDCLELARESYHPALCDRDISALAKDASVAEASHALYSLLLLRSLAMSETQQAHPLDLSEVKYIWGDFSTAHEPKSAQELLDPHGGNPRNLPFSFKYNVLLPLNMLEKMDVNIFDNDGMFDTWVFNTLYAKFRGTASAKQGPDGRPEIAAVHPMWCLANHSCDPDVTWTWSGGIQLLVKQEREPWHGKDPHAVKPGGIRKGDEVMNHYCDVTLSVYERREWAVGALGGVCQCPRCQFEFELREQERSENLDQ